MRLIVSEAPSPARYRSIPQMALYVICRLPGVEAERRVGLMLDSGHFNVVSASRVSRSAAERKCLFPASIVDRHTLTLARDYMPALFCRLEWEFKLTLSELERWWAVRYFFLAEQRSGGGR